MKNWIKATLIVLGIIIVSFLCSLGIVYFPIPTVAIVLTMICYGMVVAIKKELDHKKCIKFQNVYKGIPLDKEIQ